MSVASGGWGLQPTTKLGTPQNQQPPLHLTSIYLAICGLAPTAPPVANSWLWGCQNPDFDARKQLLNTVKSNWGSAPDPVGGAYDAPQTT